MAYSRHVQQVSPALAEEDIQHRPSREEISFFKSVAQGDMDFVRENCGRHRFTDLTGVGVLSRDPIQNLKYHFVVTAAVMTRVCIEYGMREEEGFRLSDYYIARVDTLRQEKDIASLHDSMVMDYAGKMRLLKKNPDASKPVIDTVNYIYAHLRERITVDELSEQIGISSSYLSRLFKQELGISISDYIRERKIEAAENLLKYSDYSVIDIANHFSFSSQSHFIQTFRSLVGMTPGKYREANQKASWFVAVRDSAETEDKGDTVTE